MDRRFLLAEDLELLRMLPGKRQPRTTYWSIEASLLLELVLLGLVEERPDPGRPRRTVLHALGEPDDPILAEVQAVVRAEPREVVATIYALVKTAVTLSVAKRLHERGELRHPMHPVKGTQLPGWELVTPGRRDVVVAELMDHFVRMADSSIRTRALAAVVAQTRKGHQLLPFPPGAKDADLKQVQAVRAGQWSPGATASALLRHTADDPRWVG